MSDALSHVPVIKRGEPDEEKALSKVYNPGKGGLIPGSSHNVDYALEGGYQIHPSFLDQKDCDIYTRYFLAQEKFLPNIGDGQCPGMHCRYSDFLTDSLLEQYTPFAQQQMGDKKIYPCYSYYRVYRTGAQLKPHYDRESCEVSMTICIGRQTPSSWPIVMDQKPVYQFPGDMVLYMGSLVEHSRPILDGGWHVQVFLHWTTIPECKFDEREGLYRPPTVDQRERIPKDNILENADQHMPQY